MSKRKGQTRVRGGPARGSGGPPLSRARPPRVNPETYRSEEVTALLKKAAYFAIFNAPNPNSPNQTVPLIPGIPFLAQYLMVAVNVNEELHRFEVLDALPTPSGLHSAKIVGEPVADVHIRFTPIPWDFQAAPNKYPSPPRLLIPFISQRVAMLEGGLQFKDEQQSGFKAFGTARTFPVNFGGQNQLRIGAAIEILEGLGKFQGLTGAFVINGYIAPPHGLALNLMVRVMDPEGRLQSDTPMTPIRPIQDPDPEAAFLIFLAEADPDRPITLNFAPGGRIASADIHERLRLFHIGFDLNPPQGIRSKTAEGPVVGTHSRRLYFYTDPANPSPVSPLQDTNGFFTFFDGEGKTIGTLNADMVEGRALATDLAGAPSPVLRITGFGPLISGTGQFANVSGMMSTNGALSLFPRALSILYVLRIADPDGKFRTAVGKTWY